ncbi:MAG: CoA transferase, partial [Thermodesulfobacteriota bacterium]|nr:CoA transferase [Thermodesulfobacteriota bacterium]
MKHCMLQKALGGIKVLDLSEHISGPYCTKLLGMFGAEVIKVERPKEGDSARIVGPFLEDGKNRREQSALFLYLNTHKRSITLDIET